MEVQTVIANLPSLLGWATASESGSSDPSSIEELMSAPNSPTAGWNLPIEGTIVLSWERVTPNSR